MEVKQKLLTLLVVFVSVLPCIILAYETKIIDQPGSINELKLPIVLGPESIAFDPMGYGPYTGVSNGRILKWQGKMLGWTDFAYNSMYR
jgi:hypothetical protein